MSGFPRTIVQEKGEASQGLHRPDEADPLYKPGFSILDQHPESRRHSSHPFFVDRANGSQEEVRPWPQLKGYASFDEVFFQASVPPNARSHH